MRIEAIFIGLENGGVLGKEIDMYNAKRDIEDIKRITIKQQKEAVKEILEDINKSTQKEVIKNETAKEMKEWTIEQFKNFNIYKVKNTYEKAAEVEIIQITQEEKADAIKELELI